jgi:hypothetical protein
MLWSQQDPVNSPCGAPDRLHSLHWLRGGEGAGPPPGVPLPTKARAGRPHNAVPCGPRRQGTACNVAKADQVKELARFAQDRFGRIDLWWAAHPAAQPPVGLTPFP